MLVVPTRHIVNAGTVAARGRRRRRRPARDGQGGGRRRGDRRARTAATGWSSTSGPTPRTAFPTSTSTSSGAARSTGPRAESACDPRCRSAALPAVRPERVRAAGRVAGRAHVAGTPVKILVPGNHLMAGLLGQRDELLRLIEARLPRRPDRRPGQRGHRGAERLRRRRRCRPGGVPVPGADHPARVGPGPRRRAAAADHRHDARRRPTVRGPHQRAACARLVGRCRAPEDRRAEGLRRRHRPQHRDLRRRPGRAPASRTWPWPWPCRRSRPARSAGSSSPVPRSRPASASASCPATCWPRSTPTCARSTTRSTTCSRPRAPSA